MANVVVEPTYNVLLQLNKPELDAVLSSIDKAFEEMSDKTLIQPLTEIKGQIILQMQDK